MDKTQKNIITIGMVFSIIILVAALLFMPFLKNIIDDKIVNFWLGRISIWVCLGLIFLYVSQVEKSNFLVWNEQKLSVIEYVILFFKIIFFIIIGAIIIASILKTCGFIEQKNLKLLEIVSVLKDNLALLTFTCITAGVTEELIFRGYLMPRLAYFFNNKYAPILISSVLFGLMHVGFGTIFQVVGPIMIGFVFAVYYQKYRNIKILIFCHFFWDFMSLLASIYLR